MCIYIYVICVYLSKGFQAINNSPHKPFSFLKHVCCRAKIVIFPCTVKLRMCCMLLTVVLTLYTVVQSDGSGNRNGMTARQGFMKTGINCLCLRCFFYH